MSHSNSYDIVIVGAGIVGLATALALLKRMPDLSLCVVEKEVTVAQHQTGHNSGVLHSGIYYAPGSLKAQTCSLGRSKMIAFCEEEQIPFEICGKVIVATKESELDALSELERRARANGVRAARIGANDLRALEPEVAGLGALHVPDAGLVPFRLVAERMKDRLAWAGVNFLFEHKLVGFAQRGREVHLETSQGRLLSRYVVNCTGLQSDRVAELAGVHRQLRIVPFRGEYYELTPEARSLVNNLVYPVPRPGFPFLGVHFTRALDGKVECGPNAVWNGSREQYQKGSIDWTDVGETLCYPGFWKLAARHYRMGLEEVHRSLSKSAFVKAAQELIPRLRAEHLVTAPAGIRAQAVTPAGDLVDDFALHATEFVLSVLNAPSPAATASLAIGDHIARQVGRALGEKEMS
jgi:(S)-2-hydroxyglutarate dehydrogenase